MTRPKAFWLILLYNIFNFAIYTWFIYWASVLEVLYHPSFENYLFTGAIIVLHTIKLMAIVLLTSTQRVVYYLQIVGILLSVISWLLVVHLVPPAAELFVIANMAAYSLLFLYWLRPAIRKHYTRYLQNID